MVRKESRELQYLYSAATTLLTLGAVRPILSFRIFTVQLQFYSHYGTYSMHRTSVKLEYIYNPTPTMRRADITMHQCMFSSAISLLTYWPYDLYRGSVPILYSCNSTPPMVLTDSTDPQLL